MQVWYVRLTTADGTVLLVPVCGDHEHADRLAQECQRDPTIREAVAVLRPAPEPPRRSA